MSAALQVIEFVGAVREAGFLPNIAFAAAVPRSWGRVLSELIDDVAADHAAMAKRRAVEALAAAQSEAQGTHVGNAEASPLRGRD